MIYDAIQYGISRKDSDRRGNGLPSLKGFIDSSKGGFLRVISKNGDYTYYKNNKPRSYDMNVMLDGTLIIWSLQLSKESVGSDGIIEITEDAEPNNMTQQFVIDL